MTYRPGYIYSWDIFSGDMWSHHAFGKESQELPHPLLAFRHSEMLGLNPAKQAKEFPTCHQIICAYPVWHMLPASGVEPVARVAIIARRFNMLPWGPAGCSSLYQSFFCVAMVNKAKFLSTTCVNLLDMKQQKLQSRCWPREKVCILPDIIGAAAGARRFHFIDLDGKINESITLVFFPS